MESPPSQGGFFMSGTQRGTRFAKITPLRHAGHGVADRYGRRPPLLALDQSAYYTILVLHCDTIIGGEHAPHDPDR